MNERARQKLILALDFDAFQVALNSVQSLSPFVGMFKINIHLFTAKGPSSVQKIHALGGGIFLDLKFHDIPNTVKGAVNSAMALPGVQLLNVHALGGLDMMRAAVKARDEAAGPGRKSQVPKLLHYHPDQYGRCRAQGGWSYRPSLKRVVQLARLAKKAGMDGVVASPQEIRAIRRACGKDFLIVVPGIRPAVAPVSGGKRKGKTDDQARIATPAEAVRAGADYLVIGRPITAAPDPVSAAQAILEEIELALPEH